MPPPGKPVRLEIKDGIALITIDNPPVNATSQAVRAGLLESISNIQNDRDVEAAVIAAEGRTFVAGGDLRDAAVSLARELVGTPVRRTGTLAVPAFDGDAAEAAAAGIAKKARG